MFCTQQSVWTKINALSCNAEFLGSFCVCLSYHSQLFGGKSGRCAMPSLSKAGLGQMQVTDTYG